VVFPGYVGNVYVRVCIFLECLPYLVKCEEDSPVTVRYRVRSHYITDWEGSRLLQRLAKHGGRVIVL
jgi:hypothetical protein